MLAFRPGWFVVSLLVAWCLVTGTPGRATEPCAVAVWIPGPGDGLAARQVVYLLKRLEKRLPNHFAFNAQTGTAFPAKPNLLNQARTGKVDIVVVDDAVIDEVPRLSMFRPPWLFRARDHVRQAMYAGLEDEIRSHIEDTLKVVVVGIYENSFHQSRADRVISGPEDLSHRKILVNDGLKMRDLMRSLGAVPQKYPAEKADEALDSGIVDSFDGALDALARLPKRVTLEAFTPNRFASTVAQRRAAHEKTFGSDWLELIDIDDAEARAPR